MSSPEFWNQRYNQSDYVYGKSPNDFFFQELSKLPVGNLLLPCEGEGRNAVAAAALGWQVTAFDQSEVARKKALRLAIEKNVTCDYRLGELHELELENACFDAVALIFAHLPSSDREYFHKSVGQLLMPGGQLILEGFHSKQLGNCSGGPRQKEMLFTEEVLLSDFSDLTIKSLTVVEIELDEGALHKGMAHVIRLLAEKP